MSTVEAHKAFHDALESSKSWNEALADNKAFIIPVYVAAIIPWALLTAFDNIDGRWRPIRRLYIRTFFQVIFIIISIVLLLWYVRVQCIAQDFKEVMAGVAVLVAALFPAIRVYRQVWIILATRSFAKIIQTVPNLTGECQPVTENGQLSESIYDDPTPELFNSSHFFDNDRPGDGVLRLSATWSILYVWNCFLASCKRLSRKQSAKPLSTNFAEGKLDALVQVPEYLHAFSNSRNKLRAVDSFSVSEPAEDILTKMAWIYGNAFVDSHDHPFIPSRKIIHLGLLVQVGYSMSVETWQNIAILKRDRADDYNVTYRILDSIVQDQKMLRKYSWFVPFLGGNASSRTTPIWTCDYTLGIVPSIGANSDFSPHHYEDAYLKLPVTSGTTARHIFPGYRWEHTAEIISSTLELHSLKTSLLGDGTIFKTGDSFADIIWTYVYVAVVLGTYGKEKRKSGTIDIYHPVDLSAFETRSPLWCVRCALAFSELEFVRSSLPLSFIERRCIAATEPSWDSSADLADIRKLLLRLAGKSESKTGLRSTNIRTGGQWWNAISGKCLAVADLICYGAKPIRKAMKNNFSYLAPQQFYNGEREKFLRSIFPACTGNSETSAERSKPEMYRDVAPEGLGCADQMSKLQKMIDEAENASRDIMKDTDMFIRQRLHEHKWCICTDTDVETGIRCAWQVERSAADAEAQSSDASSPRNNASEVSDEERKWKEWGKLAR